MSNLRFVTYISVRQSALMDLDRQVRDGQRREDHVPVVGDIARGGGHERDDAAAPPWPQLPYM